MRTLAKGVRTQYSTERERGRKRKGAREREGARARERREREREREVKTVRTQYTHGQATVNVSDLVAGKPKLNVGREA